jgi:EAL domain-containing protein (putative c-di-GMP-specific phosphodiesterase class I)/GGDEF domain-containing protein/CBS domain-containing protein
MLRDLFFNILRNRTLSAVFQPIIGLDHGAIIGYEGLIRGPVDTSLHLPSALFETAQAVQMRDELEALCREVVIDAFTQLALPGSLFLNVSPLCMLDFGATLDEIVRIMPVPGLSPDRIVLELTESDHIVDVDLLVDVTRHYRKLGFRLALDDLGAGFSSLLLWSKLRPEFVKFDQYFAHGIEHDPVNAQFMRSIQDIARTTNTTVIAEGIESHSALRHIAELGIACGQGYYIGRPVACPSPNVHPGVQPALSRPKVLLQFDDEHVGRHAVTARRLLRRVTPAAPTLTNIDLFNMFTVVPDLEIIPIVDAGRPVGLVTRRSLFDLFATQFIRELHGRKPCTMFMDPEPMVVDQHTPLQTLSKSVVEAAHHHLFNGFIITADGDYVGMGTGHDLMREITALQLSAARYANPLTGLPGNVPLNEHIDRLLDDGIPFAACYIDLDHFKPFNDCYGYRRGDDVLKLTGSILESVAYPSRDFIGHIGGDDFLVLFSSDDWEQRCHAILESFGAQIVLQFDQADLLRGGYLGEDRQGRHVIHPLVTVSLGIVKAEPGHFSSHLQIATAASEAKRQAKRIYGNSMFVDRRAGPEAGVTVSDRDSPHGTRSNGH